MQHFTCPNVMECGLTLTRNGEDFAVAAEENMATSIKRVKFFTCAGVPEFGPVLSSPDQSFAAGAEGYFYEIFGMSCSNDAFRFLRTAYRLSK